MSVEDILKTVKEKEVKFIDYRFTNTNGKEQHVTVTANEDGIKSDFTEGKMFDGSSIAGWKDINESDMILMPDSSTAVMDPFYDEPTLIVTCDVIEPADGNPYEKDPRSIAKKAEAYLKETGIADKAFFGPENEFFVFYDPKEIAIWTKSVDKDKEICKQLLEVSKQKIHFLDQRMNFLFLMM